MTGLERFMEAKRAEIAYLERLKAETSAFEEGGLLKPWSGSRPSLRAALEKEGRACAPLSVIAEFKKASPSRGVICERLSVEEAVLQYAENGASALSILTEQQYFHGDTTYLARAAEALAKSGRRGGGGVEKPLPAVPLLRKDFLFHPVQVEATLATPASALLLIVRLTPDVRTLRALREQAEAGGVEAVVEIFDEGDLRLARDSGARIIQVNARDLATLRVDREACLRLIRHFPPREDELWIAASGMTCRDDLEAAAGSGYRAALVGSALMEHGTPGASLHRLLYGEERSEEGA